MSWLHIVTLLVSGLAQDTAEPPLALVGGRVLTEAGTEPLEGATVLVRQGRIEAVGTDLTLPEDARALDVSGLVLAPAFVDAAHELELDFGAHDPQPGRPVDDGRDVFPGMLDANRRGLAPERGVRAGMARDASDREAHRAQGFGSLLVAPGDMLLGGRGAWLVASGRPVREALLRDEVAQFGSLHWRSRRSEDYEGTDYPATLMGVLAHLRQALLDAEHHALVTERFTAGTSLRRPVHDPTLDALLPVLRGEVLLVLEAQEEEDVRLALGLGERFPGLDLVIAGGREAWELAEELAARQIPVVLDMEFPDEPDDPDAESEEEPGETKGPGKGRRGQGGRGQDRSAEDDPSPPGPPGPFDPGVPERLQRDRHRRWVERVSGAARLLEAGVTVAFGSFGREPSDLVEDVRVAVESGDLGTDQALAALTSGGRSVFGEGAPAGRLVPGALANVAAWDGELLDEDAELAALVVDGRLFEMRDELRPEEEDEEEEDESEAESEAEAEEEEEEARTEAVTEDDAAEDEDEAAEPDGPWARHPYQVAVAAALQAASDDVDWPVELDEDRVPSVRTGGDVLVRDATLLTASDGTRPDTDLLVRDGRIEALGPDLPAPEGITVIDAEGRFVAPGIIDCHAHVAIRGGINEWTRSVTPEVTIEDEVDPDHIGIYRALAGGTTSARLLHGSANAIGGRHEVVKFRWGADAPDMVFEGAARGVKFALGENPRQANWGRGGRFPRTRMGVEAVFRRSFEEAQRYREAWQRFADEREAGRDPDPPRRDLRLEALVGILDGSIPVHSHCYRAHEILMLIRIAEEFGFRVATFQHVLEGYKVGREIAAHGGLGGSTFVDWWGFKYEVEDATPYNPALVHEAGALMSVNSDSADHIRRLHLEAAKVVKYGGIDEQDALRMVTLHPAVQLGIDDRVGSLEVGKDADFAVYSHHPFDTRARVLQTFVDGELLFERREGVYDAWLAEVEARIAAGREALATAAASVREPTALETRAREVDAAALEELSAPREGTRAPSTPPRPPPPPVALVGGTVHTMDGEPGEAPVLEEGVVLLRDGLVAAVQPGPADEATLRAAGYAVRDVSGLHVWPGLVDAGGTLGLGEIALVRQSMDAREVGGDQADLRASTAWHPASEQIPVTRVNGVTTALAVPEGSGLRGQSSLMALEGWTVSDALVQDAVAMHVQTPRTSREQDDRRDDLHEGHERGGRLCLDAGGPPPVVPTAGRGDGQGEDLGERVRASWEDLEEQFVMAREYARVAGAGGRPDYDPRLEALAPYVLGQAPVVFEANGPDQIADALDFAARHDLQAIIAGGREAWKVADRLVLADVPVIVGPVLSLPAHRSDPYDAAYANAGLLHASGVRIGFRTDAAWSARDLPYHAAMAVAFGLDEDVALQALTAGNAEILGVGDRLGRLAPGLRADVIVTDGSPLQIRTRLEAVFVGGRDVGLESKHTRLYETYGGRLRDPSRPSPPR